MIKIAGIVFDTNKIFGIIMFLFIGWNFAIVWFIKVIRRYDKDKKKVSVGLEELKIKMEAVDRLGVKMEAVETKDREMEIDLKAISTTLLQVQDMTIQIYEYFFKEGIKATNKQEGT